VASVQQLRDATGTLCVILTPQLLSTAGQTFTISDPDAITAAQGAVAAANAGNCPQAVTALNLAESSPSAMSSAYLDDAKS
jgi:hypothetical protein